MDASTEATSGLACRGGMTAACSKNAKTAALQGVRRAHSRLKKSTSLLVKAHDFARSFQTKRQELISQSVFFSSPGSTLHKKQHAACQHPDSKPCTPSRAPNKAVGSSSDGVPSGVVPAWVSKKRHQMSFMQRLNKTCFRCLHRLHVICSTPSKAAAHKDKNQTHSGAAYFPK